MNLLFGLLLTAVLPAIAQEAGWDKLQTVEQGKRVAVLLRDNKYIEGRFRAWQPDRLDIERRNRTESLKSADVRRVSIRTKGSRAKSAVLGAVIAFGAAFPFGAASAGYLTDQNNPRFQTRLGMGAGFGLFGASIGAAIGALAGGTKNVVVYRAGRQP
jgi:hypothetical protein